jgi:phosphoribosyl 1,2-cyclic phosphate phosphodiesterase
MKLKYLGTAAAEGIPGMFCNCRVCRNALKIRGKEIKTRSQALLDDKLLIDFPADTYMHILNHGLDLRNIHNVIITHSHSDHFYPNDFWCRFEGIAYDIVEEPLNIYVTEAGYNEALRQLGEDLNETRVKFHKIAPFEPFDVEDYHIIPLAADHDSSSDPVIYIIEKGGKSLLYAHDTGIFPDSTWDYLEKYNKKFELISLDCTGMAQKNWRRSHLCLNTDKEVYDRLTEIGVCDKNTIVYVNHFSHNGMLTHEELVVEAEKYGFLVTYDSLEVVF